MMNMTLAERERLAWIEGRVGEAAMLAAIEDGDAVSYGRGYEDGLWDGSAGYKNGLHDEDR